MSKIRTLCLASLASAGLVSAPVACDVGGIADTGMNNEQPGELDSTTTALAIRFQATGSTETRCGVAAGVSVQISDALGEVKSCTAGWAPGLADGQRVADCFFVAHPGEWMIDDIAVVDAQNQTLECCEGANPDSLVVNESETTEFGASFTCDTVNNGALDIFARINRPPTIEDLDISPSKFSNTCSLVTLDAEAVDPDEDSVTYQWSVIDSPKAEGDDFAIFGIRDRAFFVGNSAGTYTLRLEVMDDFDAMHHLDFPLHLTADDTSCIPGDALDDQMPESETEEPDEEEEAP